MADKPEKEFGASSVKAVIWQNERESKDGGKFKVPSIQVTRRYRNKTGEWKEATSFRKEDLAYLLVVVRAALDYLALKTRDPSEDGKPSEKEQ